ncbi:hypothetical protein, conserved [Eimeria tenella]|uniref:Protein kinase domain-containing protein n=1 Tax=Eimeria tenella TaxID=5802 RepID=U6KVZ7_EIMTE|nr:hypothetical protein, conserved [Eimeria tenella]CDJ39680.1 hypothetical protein, conserved [Eimeria tenella]|eukprot:XP_013230435.1 hypothetical protein, conserved [Eimeria tenella]
MANSPAARTGALQQDKAAAAAAPAAAAAAQAAKTQQRQSPLSGDCRSKEAGEALPAAEYCSSSSSSSSSSKGLLCCGRETRGGSGCSSLLPSVCVSSSSSSSSTSCGCSWTVSSSKSSCSTSSSSSSSEAGAAAQQQQQQQDLERVRSCRNKGDEKRMQQELLLSKLLDHPNIIKTYEVFSSSSKLWAVMELCTGGTLLQHAMPPAAAAAEQQQQQQHRGADRRAHRRPVLGAEPILLSSEAAKAKAVRSIFEEIDWGLSIYKPLRSNGVAQVLQGVLEKDPRRRWSSRQVLQHPYFRGYASPGPPLHTPAAAAAAAARGALKPQEGLMLLRCFVALLIMARLLREEATLNWLRLFRLLDSRSSGALQAEELQQQLAAALLQQMQQKGLSPQQQHQQQQQLEALIRYVLQSYFKSLGTPGFAAMPYSYFIAACLTSASAIQQHYGEVEGAFLMMQRARQQQQQQQQQQQPRNGKRDRATVGPVTPAAAAAAAAAAKSPWCSSSSTAAAAQLIELTSSSRIRNDAA